MARLYRPHIPLEVRCYVVLRQLGWEDKDIERRLLSEDHRSGGLGFARYLNEILLPMLAEKIGCAVSDFNLDHDPPLAARPQERRGLGKKTYYVPDANDPEHLYYRPHGAQFEGSHLIKTNVRGDHGQHPDRVLIKKQRRLERGPKPKRSTPIKSRGFAATGKTQWPKRPFRRK